ncbi:AAA family ATPase [Bacteroides sp. 519]|nr:AAA family ATPase [Bacteroides sp. 519]
MNNSADTRFPRRYPIGIQSFEKLRSEGYLYVDKTSQMYKLIQMGNPYFLSRPRRFGKSLMLSTLEAYFLGKKELFKGLFIETVEKDWKTYPVIKLSLNAERYENRQSLYDILERKLLEWEELYETGGKGITHSGRFMEVIKSAYEKTGLRVVVLIDEYDKPLLRSFHDEKLQDDFREILTAFYTVLKDADEWIQFVFITGVTKFAQVGIFSNLNQLMDISFDPRFADLCGLTQQEIEDNFAPGLETLAQNNNISREMAVQRLTRMYDGYHFSYNNMVGMFNPFSVLNCLSSGMFEHYWFASGTPTFLVEMLKKTDMDLRGLEDIEVSTVFLAYDQTNWGNTTQMLYRMGYLTIKSYDERFRMCKLGYPNEEVKSGLLHYTTHIA